MGCPPLGWQQEGGRCLGPRSPSLTSFFRGLLHKQPSSAAPYWGNDGSVGNEDNRLHHLQEWIPLVNSPSPTSRHQFGNEKGELGAGGRQARCFLSHPRSSGCLIFWGFPERFCVCEEGNMQAWVGTYMCLCVQVSVHACASTCMSLVCTRVCACSGGHSGMFVCVRALAPAHMFSCMSSVHFWEGITGTGVSGEGVGDRRPQWRTRPFTQGGPRDRVAG